jgi:hypothetical protein
VPAPDPKKRVLAERWARIEHPIAEYTFVSLVAGAAGGDEDRVLVYAVSSVPLRTGRYRLIPWPPLTVVDTGFTVYAIRGEDYVEVPMLTRADVEANTPSAFAVVPLGGRVVLTAHSITLVQHKMGRLALHRPSALLDRALTSGDTGVRTVFTSPALTLVRCPGVYSAALANHLPPSMESLLLLL